MESNLGATRMWIPHSLKTFQFYKRFPYVRISSHFRAVDLGPFISVRDNVDKSFSGSHKINSFSCEVKFTIHPSIETLHHWSRDSIGEYQGTGFIHKKPAIL